MFPQYYKVQNVRYAEEYYTHTFKLTNGKSVTWNYNNFFDCDSTDVVIIVNTFILEKLLILNKEYVSTNQT